MAAKTKGQTYTVEVPAVLVRRAKRLLGIDDDQGAVIAALELATMQGHDAYPPDEVACANIRRLLIQAGAALDYRYGWISSAALSIGVGHRTAYTILARQHKAVDGVTVTAVARATGCAMTALYRYDPAAFNDDFSLKEIGPNGKSWRGSRRQKNL